VVCRGNPKELDAAAKLTALPYPTVVEGICFGPGRWFFIELMGQAGDFCFIAANTSAINMINSHGMCQSAENQIKLP